MIRNLWPLLIGFGLWAIAFILLYSVQALGCVWHWPPFWHRALMIAIAIGTVASLAVIFFWQKRPGSLQAPGILLTAAAIFASAVIFAPTLFASSCV